jgi:hypothetical protein
MTAVIGGVRQGMSPHQGAHSYDRLNAMLGLTGGVMR